jgi:hypothetical protein
MVAVGKTYLSLALGARGYKESNRGLLDQALAEARRAVKAFQGTNEPPQSIALAHRFDWDEHQLYDRAGGHNERRMVHTVP